MVSPKFKRVKTLNITDDDQTRPITSVTTTTSAAAIPYLPDDVIEQILSFLPIKLAARASAVSKHWASLWPSFPVLDIDEGELSDPDDPAKFQRFLRFLENCIHRCRNQRSLDKLRLRVRHSVAGDDSVTIDECVTFALERCVKELELCFVEKAENEVSLYLIPQAVFSSHFLTSLNLEKVRINLRSRVSDDDPITLPSMITMSLKEIDFEDEIDVDILLSGCPRLEDLELNLCNVPGDLDISSVSLSELEISNCHAVDFEVNCKNLAIFVFRSECSCAHHDDEALFLWECGNLLFLYVTGVGLKQLHLLGCEQSMENHIYTPSLVYFFFSGVVEAKIHFKHLPPGLLDATVIITNLWWSFEYYSFLRDFLGSFDCCRELEIEIRDAEGVIIPEHCRTQWSPPLSSIKQLQLTFTNPLWDREYWLNPSLSWIAPSAEILPHQYNSTIFPIQY